MAKYSKVFECGDTKHILVFEGQTYDFTQKITLSSEHGFRTTSDKPGFDVQLSEKGYTDAKIIETFETIDYSNDHHIKHMLAILSTHEERDDEN